VKAGKNEQAIFKLFSLGVVTARDEWVYGLTEKEVAQKVNVLIDYYEKIRLSDGIHDSFIKWTRAVKADLSKNVQYLYNENLLRDSLYRPFVTRKLYFSQQLNEMQYKLREIFTNTSYKNVAIGISGGIFSKPFQTLAVSIIPCYDLLEKTQFLPLYIYSDGTREENVTDWALMQFREYYETENIEKLDIFHYVYAVLHDRRYRQTFALNLKQEFPRIPFYPEFEKWANIGKQLIDLHINFEKVEPYPLKQIDKKVIDTPKCKLKADKTKNIIELDSQTTLENNPPEAWQYQLGNRSALEWILDQYKEKTPRDATIRETFNTYRFVDYKEQVIELLKKVCYVSVETIRLIEQIERLRIE
jgi:predicted helicase